MITHPHGMGCSFMGSRLWCPRPRSGGLATRSNDVVTVAIHPVHGACESQDDVRVDPGSQAASQFATIVVELVPYRSRAVVAGFGVLAFLIKASSWTVFVPKQCFVVRLLRRTDGKELARYDYVHMSDASFHASSLARRMSSWNVSDLCAHLGLSRVDVLSD